MNLASEAGARSWSIFPAGSNGEFNLPRDQSIVIRRGEGCRLWDVDGREFLDFSMGWGSALVGHARPEIVRAVSQRVADGANFAYITDASLELAEKIAQASPACERLRFCASGTEAVQYALRLARAFTGRPKILKFEGAYHGAGDVGVVSLFPKRRLPFPAPEPTSAGLDPGITEHVLVAPFNDLDVVRAILDKHGPQIAAVIVEPLHRCIVPTEGFLAGLKRAVHAAGALLVFDEVVTGFRLAYGGAQQYYGVMPDLVAYGKALGGGLPIGAFGGRADILDLVREDGIGGERYVWTASTLGGNPVSSAAATAALDIYASPETYPRLFALGERLRRGMAAFLAERGVAGQILGDGPLAQVALTPEPVVDYRSSQRADPQRGRALMLGLFRRGVFLNPMGTKLYLSLAHDEAAIGGFLDRLGDALKEVFGP